MALKSNDFTQNIFHKKRMKIKQFVPFFQSTTTSIYIKEKNNFSIRKKINNLRSCEMIKYIIFLRVRKHLNDKTITNIKF